MPLTRTAALVLVALTVVLAACRADTPEPSPSPTATPPATSPTPTATPTPPGPSPTAQPGGGDRLTGDPALDAIIEAVQSRDIAALAGHIETMQIACANVQGLGGPPQCRPGEEPGSIRTVIPVAVCEGTWSDTPIATVGRFSALARGLYAVVDASSIADRFPDEWPEPDQFLVFHVDLGGNAAAARLVLTEGKITMVYYGCGLSPEDAAGWPQVGPLPVVAGPFGQPLAAHATSAPTGIAEVDALVAAVEAYEIETLIELTELAQHECVDEERDIQQIACNAQKGEQPGDLVDVLPTAFCHGALSRDLVASYSAMLNGAPTLYGVARPADRPDVGVWTDGAWWVVFELHTQPGAPSVRVTLDEDGDIRNLWYGCSFPPEQQLDYGDPKPEVIYREGAQG